MQSTLHYNFPLYEGEDSPNLLVEWNGTMQALDTKLYALSIGNAGPEIIREIEQLITAVNGLITEVTEAISDIDDLQDTVNGVQQTVNTLFNNVDDIQDTLVAMQATVASVQALISALQGTVTENSEDIESLQNSVSTLTSTMATLNGALTNMQRDIDDLDGTVSEIDRTVFGLRQSVSSLDTSVSNLDTSVSNLDTNVSNLDTSVSSLDTRVTALENQPAPGPGPSGSAPIVLQNTYTLPIKYIPEGSSGEYYNLSISSTDITPSSIVKKFEIQGIGKSPMQGGQGFQNVSIPLGNFLMGMSSGAKKSMIFITGVYSSKSNIDHNQLVFNINQQTLPINITVKVVYVYSSLTPDGETVDISLEVMNTPNPNAGNYVNEPLIIKGFVVESTAITATPSN